MPSSPCLIIAPNGTKIVRRDPLEGALVDGDFEMRVGGDEPVSWKVLPHRSHSPRPHSVTHGGSEMRGCIGITMQGAVTDHRAFPVIEIEDRPEAEIDADRPEFGGDREPHAHRLPCRLGDVAVPPLAQRAHRRYRREALAKALDPAAFVIHRDQQGRRAHARGSRRSTRRAVRNLRNCVQTGSRRR